MAIKILTDSTCDLDYRYIDENKDILRFIGMPISIDQEDYIDDLGKTLAHELVYDKLEAGIFPKTSQINVTEFLDTYNAFYSDGDTLFVLGLSSGLSGTINNAMLAKNMLEEEKGAVDIRVVDTLAASIGLGAIIVEIVRLVRDGKGPDDIEKWLEDSVLKVNHWFAIDDLIHLQHGGRIGKTSAKIGTALKVKPILTMSHDGKLELYSAVRGRVKSIKFLMKKVEENYNEDKNQRILIGHCNCEKDALKLKQSIEEEYNIQDISISKISATIATHVGPGMLAIAFIGKDVREKSKIST